MNNPCGSQVHGHNLRATQQVNSCCVGCHEVQRDKRYKVDDIDGIIKNDLDISSEHRRSEVCGVPLFFFNVRVYGWYVWLGDGCVYKK